MNVPYTVQVPYTVEERGLAEPEDAASWRASACYLPVLAFQVTSQVLHSMGRYSQWAGLNNCHKSIALQTQTYHCSTFSD